MSNNLVNQSTKAISTNELRWIGPVLAVVSSGPMDLFFYYFFFNLHMVKFIMWFCFYCLYMQLKTFEDL